MNTPKNLLIANPDQNIVLTPVEVIRRMFAYSEDRRSKAKETMTAINRRRQKDNFKKLL